MPSNSSLLYTVYTTYCILHYRRVVPRHRGICVVSSTSEQAKAPIP